MKNVTLFNAMEEDGKGHIHFYYSLLTIIILIHPQAQKR